MLGWPFDPLVLSPPGSGSPRRVFACGPPRERGGRLPRSAGEGFPRGILLLDDVYTSGATAEAAASALKIAGADHIVVVTIARAVP